LSADTIVPGAANPQAYNRYSYVLNNPLRYIDPSGHGQCQTQEDCDDMGTTSMGTGNPHNGGGSNNNGNNGNSHDDDDFDPNPYSLPGSPQCYPGELVCQLVAGGYEDSAAETWGNMFDSVGDAMGDIVSGSVHPYSPLSFGDQATQLCGNRSPHCQYLVGIDIIIDVVGLVSGETGWVHLTATPSLTPSPVMTWTADPTPTGITPRPQTPTFTPTFTLTVTPSLTSTQPTSTPAPTSTITTTSSPFFFTPTYGQP
jgi:hypothetical protein